MANSDVIIRFDAVSFGYSEHKPILHEASFSIRENAKLTIMGQNGAGKSTLFQLITGKLKPQSGEVNIRQNTRIGIALQVMPQEYIGLTVKEFFETVYEKKKHDIDRDIKRVLEVVNLSVPTQWTVGDLSGGQQARLLLARAIIDEPDILLLDEPTNNLDTQGISHLIEFILGYEKTVIVISHDAAFLNLFTEGVLHLDVFTQQVGWYVGNYYDVVEEIQAQVLREQRQNAQLKKNIIDRKQKVNQFSHKGGKMRRLASKLKEEIADDEENMVQVRREDKTIPPFRIPMQEFSGVVAQLNEVTVMKGAEPVTKEVGIQLRKGEVLQIVGPNGIGKTTLLKALASEAHTGMTIKEGARVGYYQQDFSGLNFEETPFQALKDVMLEGTDKDIYGTAAQFLLKGDVLNTPIRAMSEGQKGLLSYARFVLQQPVLLILDEPTNHINFRHLPVIAEALNNFEGAIIVVSHDEEFVELLNVDTTLNLEKL